MKSFDEWYFEQRYLGIEPIDHARAAFKAGQQSKQAEIDELKREMLNKTNEAYADGQKSMRKMIKSNEDELQKRVDDAIALLEYNEYVDSPLQALEVLKGDSHES